VCSHSPKEDMAAQFLRCQVKSARGGALSIDDCNGAGIFLQTAVEVIGLRIGNRIRSEACGYSSGMNLYQVLQTHLVALSELSPFDVDATYSASKAVATSYD